jgi:hypothetical protein
MTVKQCKTCPWRVGCDPVNDIPNYQIDLARRLKKTINGTPEDGVMACHYSKPGEEIACAGWLYNQLGVGNNILVRLEVAQGTLPVPEVFGPQHSTYDATLPSDEDNV